MKELKTLLNPIKNQTTGEKVRMYRDAFKLSQTDLAELIGENQANISKIEDDSRAIGAKTAMKFCAVFNITLEGLLFPNGIENEDEFKKVRDKANRMISA